MNAIYDIPEGATDTEATWLLIDQVSRLMNRLQERELLRVGTTPEKVTTLQLIHDLGSDAITAEIARYLCRKDQSITGMLNRMEQEGLVKRTPKRVGHPYTSLELTEKGEEVREKGQKVLGKLRGSYNSWITSNSSDALLKAVLDELVSIRGSLADSLRLDILEPKSKSLSARDN